MESNSARDRGAGSWPDYKRSLLTLTSDLKRLEGLCDRAELEAQRDAIRRALRRVEEDRFQVAVLGEFKRGKSTFLNALLGREILPADILPCSATLNRVTYGLTPEVTVRFKDGREEAVAVDRLAEYVTKLTEESERTAAQVAEAVVRYPVAYCRHGVDLIDTPGLNDDAAMTEITLSILPQVDVALFLVSALSPLSQTEREFLRRHVLTSNLARVLFVITGIDRCEDAEEVERVTAHVRRWIESVVEGGETGEDIDFRRKTGEIRLFPLSAKQALRARAAGDAELLRRSRFEVFEAALERLLAEERGAVLLGVLASHVLDASGAVQEMVDRQSAEAPAAEHEGLDFAERRLARLREVRSSVPRQMGGLVDELRGRIDGALALLPAQAQLQCELAIGRADLSAAQLARSPAAATGLLAEHCAEALDYAIRIVALELSQSIQEVLSSVPRDLELAAAGELLTEQLEADPTGEIRSLLADLGSEMGSLTVALRSRFGAIQVTTAAKQAATGALSAAVSTFGKLGGILSSGKPGVLSEATAAARAAGQAFGDEWTAAFKTAYGAEAEALIRRELPADQLRRAVQTRVREVTIRLKSNLERVVDDALEDARDREARLRVDRERADAARAVREAERDRICRDLSELRADAQAVLERLEQLPASGA